MSEETVIAPGDPGQATTTPPAPSSGEGGQAAAVSPTTDDVPEKFKGKSVSDVAKSYIELEKKLGEQSNHVNATKKQLEQWQALGNVLEGNPDLYKQVEAEIERISGKKPDSTGNKSDPAPQRDDVRVATENTIISTFEKRYAIDSLDVETRGAINQRIGSELAEMLDPSGSKSVKQVIDSIPLDRLDRYLEKAYRLATINDANERARVAGLAEARQKMQASFGSIPSTGTRTSKITLSPDEQKVARKMGLSDEDYLKEKIALDKQ